MPGIKALSIMAGTASGIGVGAYLGWGRASKNKDLDMEDRLSFTTSSAIAGGVAGLAAASLGTKGITGTAGAIFNGVNNTRRIASKAGSMMFKSKWKGIPQLRGPMKLFALTAAAVGVMAYGARPRPETAAYAAPDEMGGVEYNQESSVKRRTGMLSATGDMVFGMNNSRHG